MVKKWIAISLSILISVSLMTGCGCTKKGVSADQWVMDQYGTFEDLSTIVQSFDTSMAAYAAGGITTPSMQDDLYVLCNQYYILKSCFQKENKEGIEPGTHTYTTKKGQEGLDVFMTNIGDMLVSVQDTLNEPEVTADQVVYIYMGYKENIMKGFVEYLTAYACVSEQS